MGLTLEIDNTSNAAFENHPECEVAEILRRVADSIEQHHTSGYCWDSNGNTVGRWSLNLDS